MSTVECLVHFSAGLWQFIKAQCKWQYWHHQFIGGWNMVLRSLSYIALSDAKSYWLVAESNLEKNIQNLTEKYRTPSKLQNEIKNIIIVLKCKKMFLFKKIEFNS